MNILIFDGNEKQAEDLSHYLTLAEFTCTYVTNYFEGLTKASNLEYCCIVLNIPFDNDRAMDILSMIKRESSQMV